MFWITNRVNFAGNLVISLVSRRLTTFMSLSLPPKYYYNKTKQIFACGLNRN